MANRFYARVSLLQNPFGLSVDRPPLTQHTIRNFFSGYLFTTSTALIIIWCLVLRWGEVGTFNKSINGCGWDGWEQWPEHARPHHLVFVADPQLVDAHTYPGRPWPLSTFTVKHTDLYLRRSYSRIQQDLKPDTVFFLGDLFDGGREWSTANSQSPEVQWRKYGRKFWLREYQRFCKIFFTNWNAKNSNDRKKPVDHRIIASLPGNHDLGFGQGIQLPVRDRFQAYFGVGNRIDIIANHTFVSVDTVSLSAKDQEGSANTEAIWGQPEKFLDVALDTRRKEISRYLNRSKSSSSDRLHKHIVTDAIESPVEDIPSTESTSEADFPTILLTHVPLYRAPGTPCGPLRERHPPSPPPPGQTTPVEPDDRNAISVSAGYQYQNVLTRPITSSIVEKLGGDIEYVFSGDDHDYCETVHRAYASRGAGIREITVKSISWAMGVRKPGFVLVSLWNEVDEQGKRTANKAEGDSVKTLQTHLCLLPDQLSIFINYAVMFAFCSSVLFIRAAAITLSTRKYGHETSTSDEPILPTYTLSNDKSSTHRTRSPELSPVHTTNQKADIHNDHDQSSHARPYPRNRGGNGNGNGANTTTRNSGPDGVKIFELVQTKPKPPLLVAKAFFREWLKSLLGVAWVVLLWYFYLLRY